MLFFLMIIVTRLFRQPERRQRDNLLGHHVNDAAVILQPAGNHQGRLQIDDEAPGLEELGTHYGIRPSRFVLEGDKHEPFRGAGS